MNHYLNDAHDYLDDAHDSLNDAHDDDDQQRLNLLKCCHVAGLCKQLDSYCCLPFPFRPGGWLDGWSWLVMTRIWPDNCLGFLILWPNDVRPMRDDDDNDDGGG